MSATVVNTSNAIRILLIEDDKRHSNDFRELLNKENEELLDKQNSYQLLDIAKNGYEALTFLIKKYDQNEKIDLVVTDYALGKTGLWGNELAKSIRKDYPDIKILFWSAHVADQDLEEAKLSGANGYVAKHEPNNALLEAINIIMQGGERWPQEYETKKKLTPTQEKVLRIFIQGGKTDAEIAFELLELEYSENVNKEEYGSLRDFITPKRLEAKKGLVAAHFANMFSRTGTKNRVQLCLWALRKFCLLRERLGILGASEQDRKLFDFFIDTGSIEKTSQEFKISEAEIRDKLKWFGFDNVETEAETELKKDDDDREG